MKKNEGRPRGRPRLLDRDKALAAALKLFWRHGYEGTSVADLTAAMETTPPSLYAAFGSKERLYRESVDLYMRSYGGFAEIALAEEPSARRAIERLLREAIAVYSAGPKPRGCMLTTGALTCAPEHQDVANDLARRRRAVIGTLKARFDEAVAQGELDAAVNTAGLAAFYAAVVQGLSIQARDGAKGNELEAIAERALQAWPVKKAN